MTYIFVMQGVCKGGALAHGKDHLVRHHNIYICDARGVQGVVLA
jgi:hypothetical protein